MEKKTQPTAAEIDVAAQLYVDAQAKADRAQEVADLFRDPLIEMTQSFGCVAPRSEKTRQIQGVAWIVKVTQGQSVQVNGANVPRLSKLLPKRIFRKLFITEDRYTLCKDAQALLNKNSLALPTSLLNKVRLLFSKCVEIKPTSPRLKVEPVNKEKE